MIRKHSADEQLSEKGIQMASGHAENTERCLKSLAIGQAQIAKGGVIIHQTEGWTQQQQEQIPRSSKSLPDLFREHLYDLLDN